MEKNGWVKLHRKMLDNPIIMKDAEHLAVWMYLLLNATHSEYPALFKGEKITLQPGQLITGRKSIASALDVNESKVRRILDSFENDQQIDRQRSNQNTLISLKNWEKYQLCDQQNDQQTTNDRPTTDQRPTTNKNDKNNKNGKNEIKTYSDNATLNKTILEFMAYRKSIKKPMTDNAVKLMLGKLNKMSSNVDEQIEIINQSIVNGWTGIFPLKDEKKKRSQKGNFHQFEKRNYDYEALERMLTSKPVSVDSDPELKAEAEELKKMLQEKY